MRYKLSRYNNIFKRKSGFYLWNTFSGALIKLDDMAIKYISEFNGIESDSSCFLTLKENGCIIENNIDELGRVLLDEKTMTLENTPSTLNLTIAPGLGCNYKCEYCFENKRVSHKKMTLEVQDEICNYIKNVINNNKYIKKLVLLGLVVSL